MATRHSSTEDDAQKHQNLEEYQHASDTRPPFILTKAELKLLGIAGVGFFIDGQ
ncbi:hypothetical protein FRB93_008058 [Tulasnella sp. JGI-2019a]|nr:hypothetical protein FRB93_008058 [Tulasnella sp. JGI-2019a]